MNNMGVFGWIRESVRRSVLLGFSDAVEQLGASADSSEPLNPQFAAMLREPRPRRWRHPLSIARPRSRPASVWAVRWNSSAIPRQSANRPAETD